MSVCVRVRVYACVCYYAAPFQEGFEASYAECPRLTAIVSAVAAHPAVRAWEARRAAAAAAAS